VQKAPFHNLSAASPCPSLSTTLYPSHSWKNASPSNCVSLSLSLLGPRRPCQPESREQCSALESLVGGCRIHPSSERRKPPRTLLLPAVHRFHRRFGCGGARALLSSLSHTTPTGVLPRPVLSIPFFFHPQAFPVLVSAPGSFWSCDLGSFGDSVCPLPSSGFVLPFLIRDCDVAAKCSFLESKGTHYYWRSWAQLIIRSFS
jgi:hypothetical protein